MLEAYWVAIGASFASTAVSECGDRTFIASTVLSLKCNDRWVVFWGTFSALACQTLTSAIAGELLKNELSGAHLPWTQIITTAVFILFSLRYLYEGFSGMKNLKGKPTELTQHLLEEDDLESTLSFKDHHASRGKLFWEVFGLIYITEIGDTSMVAQTALASQQNFACVFIGGCLANAVVNGAGIFFGDAVSGKLDVRVINIVAGCLFGTYGIIAAYDLMQIFPGAAHKSLR